MTLKMIKERGVKLKADETHGLLDFCVQQLRKHKDVLGGLGRADELKTSLLIRSGEAASAFDKVMAENGRILTLGQRQEMLDCLVAHIHCLHRAGSPMIPKQHAMLHLVHALPRTGSAKFTSTYKDESLNGVLARICRSSHGGETFYATVMRKMSMLLFFDEAPGMTSSLG